MIHDRIRCLLPGYETAKKEEQLKAVQKACRRALSTQDGQILFNVLMSDLHFFELSTREGDKYLTEYAKYFIRERLGISNTFELTNLILKTTNDREG